ncbi:MAG: radical SAM protein [Bacillota bacterium]
MSEYEGYEKVLQEQLKGLLSTQKPIVLFGAMALGQMAQRTVHFFGKKAVCFCDNDKTKQGKIVDGLTVLSPEQVKKQYPNAKIYICLHNNNSTAKVASQLKALKFTDIYNRDMLFWAYQIYVVKRSVSSYDLAETMNIFNDRENRTILGNVSVVITEKCTLRCIDCGVFIPYYKHPKHHDKDKIIEGMRKLSQIVDAIENFTIIGGEPLLHKDLVEICEEASKLKNVLRVTITTNGTIVPKDSVLQSLSRAITYLTISDYGSLSINKDLLKKSLDQFGIYCNVLDEFSEWSKQNIPKPHNRGENENTRIFKSCFWVGIAAKLMNGQYHLCDFSAAVTPFNGIPENEGDYVDLLDSTLSIDEIRAKLHKLLYHTDCLKACDYCEIFQMPPTIRAAQTKEILVF